MKPIGAVIVVCLFALKASPICAEGGPAAAPPSGRSDVEDTITAGTPITMENWRNYRQFMPDGMIGLFEGKYFWKMPQDIKMELGPAIIYPLPKGYREITEKYAPGGVGQVVEKELASGFDARAIDYAVAMRPPLASYYWQGPAIRPDGVA